MSSLKLLQSPYILSYTWVLALLLITTLDSRANTLAVGSAISLENRRALPPCLKGDKLFIADSFQELRYFSSESFEEKRDQVWGHLKGSMNFLIIGASAGTEYLSETIQTDKSLS